MIAKPTIYRETIVIYASRNKETLRISTGVKGKKLLSTGLLPKTVDGYDEKNNHIRKIWKEVQDLIDKNPTLSPKEISHLHKTGELPVRVGESKKGAQFNFLDVINTFIDASKSGIRKTAKARNPSKGSIKNYEMVKSKLYQFVDATGYDVKDWNNINDEFYHKYCHWCWYTMNNYDGTVGRDIIFFRTVIRWMMNMELVDGIRINLTNWKVLKEESSDDNFLIFYEDEIKLLSEMPIQLTPENELWETAGVRLRKKVEKRLDEIRDNVLMGIFTCFRYSDLMSLTEENLVISPTGWFIHKGQEKTKNVVRVPLFENGIEIIKKYRGKYSTLLPPMSEMTFNHNLKKLGIYFGEFINKLEEQGLMKGKVYNNWDTFTRIRTRNSVHVHEIMRTKDGLSSHTCRKSGISFLLSKGLAENEVKKISGHKYDSESFFKYIRIAEQVKNQKAIDAWLTVFK